MCHFAWRPAPKTVMLWMRSRLVMMNVLARAVRKAVRVCAARKAGGWPDGERRVREP